MRNKVVFMTKERDNYKYDTTYISTMKITKICPICNKEFLIEENRLKHGRGKTCSRECQYKSNSIKLKTSIKVKCAVCGKEFERSPSQIKSENLFCSNECSYKGRSLGLVKRVVIKPYNSHSITAFKTNCLICNKEFETIPSKKHKYCSRECFEIAHKDNMKGDKNPSWIDGRSYNKRSYRGDDWDEIRMKVYKRDNYICQKCGVKCIGRSKLHEFNGSILIQCHHIDENKENNELDNLETLCVSCHGKK